MKEKIGFIINPKSGIFNKKRIPRLIDKYLDKSRFAPEIVHTQCPKHAPELAKKFVEQGFSYVVAVGGDGTVNEVASALVGTKTALGFIPSGSGNGMARHLKIPIESIRAIKLLNKAEVIDIDYCLLNGIPFFCTCGVGFDAYVSREFKGIKKRGLFGYLKKTVSSYLNYEAQEFTLLSEGKERKVKIFDITVANASQWGNDAYIAPQASVKDGKFDVVVLREMPFFSALDLCYKLMTKGLKKEKYMKSWRAREIVIKSEKKIVAHFDGESFEAENELKIQMVPRGLKVFCVDKFQ